MFLQGGMKGGWSLLSGAAAFRTFLLPADFLLEEQVWGGELPPMGTVL